ncbi:MAG TPA: hypothetical protein VF318_07790 [Dehalococcoidales bacterium]
MNTIGQLLSLVLGDASQPHLDEYPGNKKRADNLYYIIPGGYTVSRYPTQPQADYLDWRDF